MCPRPRPAPCSATRRSAPWRRSAPASRTVAVGDRVLLSCVARAGAAASARRPATASASAAAAGSSDTRSTGCRPSTRACRSPTTPSTRSPTSSATSRCSSSPTSCPPPTRSACSTAWSRPGDVVAIVGAGPDRPRGDPHRAGCYTPGRIVAIDLADSRLERAARVRRRHDDQQRPRGRARAVMELTDGLGADVAFEAVGVPQTFELAAELIRPGGRVANIGVHGHPVTLHLETLWIRDVTVTTGLVDTYTIPQLMKLVASGRLDPTIFATHRYALGDTMAAYDTFADAGIHRRAEGRARGQRAPQRRERSRRRTPRGPLMRGRHVPLLCGSCQAPTSRQEDTCWRCGARVRRTPFLAAEGVLHASEEGTRAAAPNGAALSTEGARSVAGVPVTPRHPDERRTTPAGSTNAATPETTPRRWSWSSLTRSMSATPPIAGCAGASTSTARASMRCTPGSTGTPRLAHPARAGDDPHACVATAVFANSESASVWPAPRGTTITGQAASRTRRPATPPTMTACIGP